MEREHKGTYVVGFFHFQKSSRVGGEFPFEVISLPLFECGMLQVCATLWGRSTLEVHVQYTTGAVGDRA